MTIGSFGLRPGGDFDVQFGSRTVLRTDGRMFALLPTVHTFNNVVVDYPDPPKGWIYGWRGRSNWSFNPGIESPGDPIEDYADSYAQNQNAKVWFTRLPTDSEIRYPLVAAPAGTNFFAGFVKMTRTLAPTHQWYIRDVVPLQKQDAWIPWIGSGEMEAGYGMARALHLVIEGGNLCLVAQQTVGSPAGGSSRSWGHYPSIFVKGIDREGGIFQNSGTPGVVVWFSTSSPYQKAASRVIYTDGNPSQYITQQRGQADQCTTTDPTNYRSTYSVSVMGQFGRRLPVS